MGRMLSRAFDWRYAVGKVFLIVLGILIALGIDSFAGSRADRQQAMAYLEDLALELRTTPPVWWPAVVRWLV